MKFAVSLFFILTLVPYSFAQQDDDQNKSDKKKRDVIRSLNLDSLDLEIQNPRAQVQVQVDVEADEYPGLNLSIESPADSLESYKPYTKQELQAYSDLLLDYKLTDFDRTETARPHKPARLFQVRVPE